MWLKDYNQLAASRRTCQLRQHSGARERFHLSPRGFHGGREWVDHTCTQTYTSSSNSSQGNQAGINPYEIFTVNAWHCQSVRQAKEPFIQYLLSILEVVVLAGVVQLLFGFWGLGGLTALNKISWEWCCAYRQPLLGNCKAQFTNERSMSVHARNVSQMKKASALKRDPLVYNSYSQLSIKSRVWFHIKIDNIKRCFFSYWPCGPWWISTTASFPPHHKLFCV